MIESISSKYVNEGIIKQFKRTRPWVLIFSFLGLIFVVVSIFSTITLFLTDQGLLAPELGYGSDSPNFGLIAQSGYQSSILVAVGLVGCIIYSFIVYYLFKFYREINNLIKTRSYIDLEATVAAQASFWKTFGVAIIINLSLIVLTIILSLLKLRFNL